MPLCDHPIYPTLLVITEHQASCTAASHGLTGWLLVHCSGSVSVSTLRSQRISASSLPVSTCPFCASATVTACTEGLLYHFSRFYVCVLICHSWFSFWRTSPVWQILSTPTSLQMTQFSSSLNDIPFYVWSTSYYPFICGWKSSWSHVLAVINSAAVDSGYVCFWTMVFSRWCETHPVLCCWVMIVLFSP